MAPLARAESPTTLLGNQTQSRIAILGTCLLVLSGGLAWLSWDAEKTSPADRGQQVWWAVALLAAMFVIYLFSVRFIKRLPAHVSVWRLIFVYGLVCRLTLLFSVPLFEVDIYRYLWDGAVVAAGENPYRFSPAQVTMASDYSILEGHSVDSDPLQKLVALEQSSPGLARVLRRVHFAELTTIYPSTSQAVFGLTEWLIPSNASLWLHVLAMKLVLILFDVGTMLVVLRLLRCAAMSENLLVIYAWCPLVLKEVANTGHLDSIAIFLTALGVLLVLRQSKKNVLWNETLAARTNFWRWIRLAGTASIFGLAVGAKVYPLILVAPACVFIARFNWRLAGAFALMSSLIATVLLSPLILARMPVSASLPPADAQRFTDGQTIDLKAPEGANHAPSGLHEFAASWEMNDLIYSITVDLLRPDELVPAGREPWFSPVPDSVRSRTILWLSTTLDVEPRVLVDRLAKAIHAVALLAIIAWLLNRLWKTPFSDRHQSDEMAVERLFCETGFLMLAWSWMLVPTQNPWYWMWTMPFVAFARNPVWLWVSGATLLYYLRFWFSTLDPTEPLLGSPYGGEPFFDRIVVWVEHGTVLVAIGLFHACQSWRARERFESKTSIQN